MSGKISLHVNVPTVGTKMNFLVPASMKIVDVIDLIVKIICEEFSGIEVQNKELLLVDPANRTVLNPDSNGLQLNLYDGSNLLLL